MNISLNVVKDICDYFLLHCERLKDKKGLIVVELFWAAKRLLLNKNEVMNIDSWDSDILDRTWDD